MSRAKGEQVVVERMPLPGATTGAQCAGEARLGSISRVVKMVLNQAMRSSQEFLRDAYTPVFLPDTDFLGRSRDSCINGVQIRVARWRRNAHGSRAKSRSALRTNRRRFARPRRYHFVVRRYA